MKIHSHACFDVYTVLTNCLIFPHRVHDKLNYVTSRLSRIYNHIGFMLPSMQDVLCKSVSRLLMWFANVFVTFKKTRPLCPAGGACMLNVHLLLQMLVSQKAAPYQVVGVKAALSIGFDSRQL